MDYNCRIITLDVTAFRAYVAKSLNDMGDGRRGQDPDVS
jgi:hypothetical protein